MARPAGKLRVRQWVRDDGLGFKNGPRPACPLAPKQFRRTLIHSPCFHPWSQPPFHSSIGPTLRAVVFFDLVFLPLRTPAYIVCCFKFSFPRIFGATQIPFLNVIQNVNVIQISDQTFIIFNLFLFGFVIFLFDITYPTLQISSGSFSLSLSLTRLFRPRSSGFGSYTGLYSGPLPP